MKKRIFNISNLGKWLLLLAFFAFSGCNNTKETPRNTPSSPSPSQTPEVSVSPEETPKQSDTPKKEEPPGQAAATTNIYDRIPERTNNLKLAIEAVNQTVLQPKEEFSFNQTVGNRTKEKGYQEAIGYDENGEKKPTVGGGICQVSSTIYMAALNGNFEITERHSHSHKVPYADENHDATVSYGGYDFRFQNNRDKPIIIEAWTDEKSVSVLIKEINEKIP